MSAPVRNRILDLIKGHELSRYLKALQNSLSSWDYADVIIGAPIGLASKIELMEALSRETNHADSGRSSSPKPESEMLRKHVSCMRAAYGALQNADYQSGEVLLASPECFCGEDGVDAFDGPFPALSWNAAQKLMRAYRSGCEGEEADWSEQYWTVDLWRLGDAGYMAGPICADYTFAVTAEGEPQFFFFGRRTHETTGIAQFGRLDRFEYAHSEPNLPVPWHPGDILRIDGRPYRPTDTYCVLLEVGDDCCGVQCAFPNEDGTIGHGALKHGHYCGRLHQLSLFGISPLYSAELHRGELPGNCAFMEKASKLLYQNPNLGKLESNMEVPVLKMVQP